MKRAIALLSALLMMFTLTSCGQSEERKVDAIKQELLEKVKEVMLDVSDKEGRDDEDVREAIDQVTVEYTDEEISNGNYTATATYCLTFKDDYMSYYYTFNISGDLDKGTASMKLLNSYSAGNETAE